jgi:hypothetical protein
MHLNKLLAHITYRRLNESKTELPMLSQMN